MKVIKRGYEYGLHNVDNPAQKGQIIQFIEKEPLAEGVGTALKTKVNGTSLKDLLEVALDKSIFDTQEADRIFLESDMKYYPIGLQQVNIKIKEALLWLEQVEKKA